MLNILDLEDYIEYIILARGRHYYESGNVLSIKKIDESYVATVRGTEDYTVTVEVDEDGDVLESECSCPYDIGPVCKHEVAVYLALQDNFSEEDGGSGDDLRELLSGQSKEKLVEFLLGLASESRAIRSQLGLEFGAGRGGQGSFAEARALIQTYFDRHSDRDGFIRWDDTSDAVVGAQKVLEKAEGAIDSEEYVEALGLVFCVTQELVSGLTHADDSSGFFGSVLEEALGLMEVIACEETLEDNEELFTMMLQEGAKQTYEHEWRLRIFGACSMLVDSNERRDLLNAQLDNIMVGLSNWSMDYVSEDVARIRYGMVERLDGKEAAAEFALNQVKHPDFREQIIRECLDKGDYAQAIAVALDGEQQDKDKRGLVHRWQKLRYEAYENDGQVEKQRELARTLVIDGEYEFYAKLRGLYTSMEWSSVYFDLLTELRKQRYTSWNNVYCKALIAEQETGLLLEYVQENPWTILDYLEILMADYGEEALAVFRMYILSEAQAANARSKYRGVCGLIKRFAKAGGQERARALAQDLVVRYKQRPAFQDELKSLQTALK